MLRAIFWLLGIAILICLLVTVIYDLINDIIERRDFKKFKEKQMQVLINLLEKKEEVIEDSETDFKVGDRVKVKRLTKGYGTIEKIDKDLGAYINFDNDESIIGYHDTYYKFNELEREEN